MKNQEVGDLDSFKDNHALLKIKPYSLKISDGIILILIPKEKAKELNMVNNADYRTPRKVDKVLWALNR